MIYGGEKEFCVQNSSDFLKQHVEPGGANFAINLGCKWPLVFPLTTMKRGFQRRITQREQKQKPYERINLDCSNARTCRVTTKQQHGVCP